MDDRTQPTTPPPAPGRSTSSSPQLADRDRFFDPGRPWCAAALGHAPGAGGYPDPETHSPFHECRTGQVAFDAVTDLDGPSLGVDVYAAAPFRFGQPRHPDPLSAPAPRVMFECYPAGEDAATARFSVTPEDAHHLGRQLISLAELLTPPRQPAAGAPG